MMRHSPEVRAVLGVGFENLILRMASYLKTTELAGDRGTITVLRAKGQRVGYAPEGEAAFVQMQRVSGVPDLGKAFASGRLGPTQLLELRRTKEARALRAWFAKGAPSDSVEEILRRYHEAASKTAVIDRLPLKLVRFGVTNLAGLVNPIAGVATSLADTFALPTWFGGGSPRLFMVKAKAVLAQDDSLPKPRVKRRRK